MTRPIPDIIDHLAQITPGSPLDRLRERRPVTKENAEKSYRALFGPETATGVSLAERFAIAVFVAELHGDSGVAAFYADNLAGLEDGAAILEAIRSAAVAAAGKGPYGRYPEGPLSAEDEAGPVWLASDADRIRLGERLSTALEHVHLLVLHPRDASPDALARLIDKGWSTTEIVTLSQLVAFLAFQIRVVAGLKLLAAA